MVGSDKVVKHMQALDRCADMEEENSSVELLLEFALAGLLWPSCRAISSSIAAIALSCRGSRARGVTAGACDCKTNEVSVVVLVRVDVRKAVVASVRVTLPMLLNDVLGSNQHTSDRVRTRRRTLQE
jgi:hypothetical protein